ncbi:hypothetical protein ABGB16_32870 [Micromonospora sp. B11E3]|uniref:hypothetical protein n=1 Tax=Micromonospora sp. B11E3 TaxID=3153562 RepID=UPI00325CE972
MGSSRASVNIGNVADFNRQFFPVDFRADHLGTWDLEGHHYACLAPFYSSSPGLVVMRLAPRQEWVELQLATMHWPHLDLRTDVLGDAGGVCAALLANERLLTDVAGAVRAGSDLLPWGTRQASPLSGTGCPPAWREAGGFKAAPVLLTRGMGIATTAPTPARAVKQIMRDSSPRSGRTSGSGSRRPPLTGSSWRGRTSANRSRMRPS